jgi:hypothetical protein
MSSQIDLALNDALKGRPIQNIRINIIKDEGDLGRPHKKKKKKSIIRKQEMSIRI